MPDAPTITEPTTTADDQKPAPEPDRDRTYTYDDIREVREEAKKYRLELRNAKTSLQELADKDKTEQEKKDEALQTAQAAVADSALRLARYEVAAEKGIPLNLAGRLQGATREELSADADKLKADFGLDGESSSNGAGGSGFDGGVRRPVKRPKSMNELIRSQAGR